MEYHLYEIKKSKFYAKVFELKNKDEIKTIVEEVKAEWKKPTHICHGYVFYEETNMHAGYDDNGEPKGTAGRPIRDLIIKRNLKNLLIVVIRYFGGIKLGAGGLVRAYMKSANLALDQFLEEQ